MKRRFKVTGQRPETSGEFEIDVERYVDASDRDDALRRTDVRWVETIREVPWDEGRGWLWRLWRRLVG